MLNAGLADKLTGSITDKATLDTLNATFAALATTSPATYLMSVVERVAAVALQISLSVVVWFAAKEKGRFWLYPLAVLLHAAVDAIAVLMAKNGVNVWIIEGAIYVMAAACAVLALSVWKKHAGKSLAPPEPGQGEDAPTEI
jgi:uncharacterized membrane protein YhfC